MPPPYKHRTRYKEPMTQELFLLRIEKQDSHWIWKGSADRYGRGQVTVNRTSWYAPRLAWVLYRGEIPKNMLVLHTRECNNARCVNPDHLYLGTDKQNIQDAISLGLKHPVDGLPMNRTHCRYNHPITGLDKHGRRFCRECVNARHRAARKALRDQRTTR